MVRALMIGKAAKTNHWLFANRAQSSVLPRAPFRVVLIIPFEILTYFSAGLRG